MAAGDIAGRSCVCCGCCALPGDGFPMILRIGGESADSSFWGSTPFAMVKLAYLQDHPYLLTPSWMTEAGSLVSAGAAAYINKSAQDASVSLTAGRTSTAVVDRLSAPSITANGSVAFDGQRFRADGGWKRPPAATVVPAGRGGYRVVVPRYSAPLLSVPATVERPQRCRCPTRTSGS